MRQYGRPHGWPYQPSTICGPETPSPAMTRPPPARASTVPAAIAAEAGGRAASCMMPVPEADALRQRGQVGERRDRIGAVRLRRPHGVEAETLGEEHRVDGKPQLRSRIADAQAELHAASRLGISNPRPWRWVPDRRSLSTRFARLVSTRPGRHGRAYFESDSNFRRRRVYRRRDG